MKFKYVVEVTRWGLGRKNSAVSGDKGDRAVERLEDDISVVSEGNVLWLREGN